MRPDPNWEKKLPPGVYQDRRRACTAPKPSGRGYELRTWVPDATHHRGGRDKWIPLGRDQGEARENRLRYRLGESPAAQSDTIHAVTQAWLDSYVKVSRNEKGHQLAHRRVQLHLLPFLGEIQAHKLTADHCRSYRLHLEAKKPKLNTQTVAHILGDLRCLLRWLEDTGRLGKSPFPRKLMPRIPESPPRTLTEDELAAVTALPFPHGFVCRLAAGTGARWSELTRLQASDLKDGVLTIHGPTKSRRMRRIPLPPALWAELRGRVGRFVPYTEASCGSFSRRVKDLSGVEAFSPHKLRHTCATRLLEQNCNLAVVQALLGHRDLATTQRYAKVTDQFVRSELARVAGFAGSP